MALTRIRVLNQQSTYNVDRLNANTLVVGGNNITGASGGGIVISSVVYLAANGTPLIANAAPTTGNSVIKIIGSGFAANANVFLNGLLQPSANVTFVDSTELRLNMSPLASNTYSLMTFNTAGAGAIFYSGVRFDPYPIWTTGTYSAIGNISTQLLVTGYGSGSISFSLASGNTLPSGLTLAANGLITGTITANTYSFYVNATDSENEITTQQISLTVAFPDTYFPYTTLLLSADSQAANNVSTETFVDSSNNNYSITATGTPYQGTFSPFPTTGTWSCYLNYGSNSGLTTTYNGTVGSGDFTAEGFFFITQRTDNTGLMLTSSTLGVIMLQNGGKLSSYFTDTSFIVWQNSTLILNTWHHIVVQRASGTLSAYLNGTRLGTQSGSTQGWTYSSITGGLIGYDGGNVGGYFSNCRISTIARYSGATITVPTSPFTSDADTVFLIAASNRFIDTSSNSRNVTVNGAPNVQRFNPFGSNGLSYSPSTDGGSIYFDGSSGVRISSNSAIAFGTGDFTAECWFYATATIGYGALFDTRTSGASSTGWTVYTGIGGTIYSYSAGYIVQSAGGTIIPNTWYHVAYVRASGTHQLFVNGVSIGTSATNTNYTDSSISIGSHNYALGETFIGYITNSRLIKGTALYTSTFTPSTTPLTAITNTSLLLLGTNSKYYDSTKINNIKNVGGVATRTDIKNYGTNSWYFNGSSYLTMLNNPIFNFPKDFTIELWLYNVTTTFYGNIFSTTANYVTANGIRLTTGPSNNTFAVGIGNSGSVTGNTTFSNNTWVHVALVRSGTSLTLYQNGINIGSVTDSTAFISDTALIGTVGAAGGAGGPYNLIGYIQDFRVTNGIARYTTTFAPPTAPVPTT